MSAQWGSTFRKRPATRLGWWAVGLAIAYIVLSILNTAILMRLPQDLPLRLTVLPNFGVIMILFGLAAGIVGVIALLRKREHSWMVWVTVLIGASTLLFVMGEFLIAH